MPSGTRRRRLAKRQAKVHSARRDPFYVPPFMSPHSKPPARGLKLRATLTTIYLDSTMTNMLVSVPG
jgi:hypothetical protein